MFQFQAVELKDEAGQGGTSNSESRCSYNQEQRGNKREGAHLLVYEQLRFSTLSGSPGPLS